MARASGVCLFSRVSPIDLHENLLVPTLNPTVSYSEVFELLTRHIIAHNVRDKSNWGLARQGSRPVESCSKA